MRLSFLKEKLKDTRCLISRTLTYSILRGTVPKDIRVSQTQSHSHSHSFCILKFC